MSKITIRLPQELKSGRDFMDEAERRYARIINACGALPWIEMRRYLEQRIADKKTIRPKARIVHDRT